MNIRNENPSNISMLMPKMTHKITNTGNENPCKTSVVMAKNARQSHHHVPLYSDDSQNDKQYSASEPDLLHKNHASDMTNSILDTEIDMSRRQNKSEKSQFGKFLNDAYRKCSRNSNFKRELKGIVDLIKKDESLCATKYPIDTNPMMTTLHPADKACRKYDVSTVELYPLHVLCALGTSPFIIRKCYRACPAAISEIIQDSVGSPLHYACLFQTHYDETSKEDAGSYLEVVQFLVTKYPALLVCASAQDKRTPLHVACLCPCPNLRQNDVKNSNQSRGRRNSTGIENIKVASGKNFDCDSVSTCSTSTSSSSVDSEKVRIKSKSKIETIKSKDAVSLRMNANGNEVLAFLTKMFPKAVNKPDAYGYLPLHLACMNNKPSLDVVEHMIRLYPEGCLARSFDGSLPFHIIARQQVDTYDKLEVVIKIIKSLIRSGGQRTLEASDKYGNIPLHISVLVDTSSPFQQKIIKYLVKKYPGGLNAKDNSGRTPRNLAVLRKRNEEMIRMLSPFV